MLAILAEDRSDVDALRAIVRRLPKYAAGAVKGRGFGGAGELLRKGAKHMSLFARGGAKSFIVCHDADGPTSDAARRVVQKRVVRASRVPSKSCCIVIPVQELEAWLLADENAITETISTLKIRKVTHPESKKDPKEWLLRESRRGRSRPLYVPAVHNAQVARHMDFDVVLRKCPSFRDLHEFCT